MTRKDLRREKSIRLLISGPVSTADDWRHLIEDILPLLPDDAASEVKGRLAADEDPYVVAQTVRAHLHGDIEPGESGGLAGDREPRSPRQPEGGASAAQDHS